MSTSSSKHNLAARMAAWSGRHRKKAFWGWLAFVVVVFMAGNAVGTTNISDVDQFSGESHRAEVALRPLRPAAGQGVRVHPERQAHGQGPGVPGRRRGRDGPPLEGSVRRERQVAAGRRQRRVSGDGHAALVDFEIAGDSTLAADRVDATLAAVAAAQAAHPALDIEQLGDASANKAINEVIGEDLAKAGELSLPLTLIILTITFGTLVAAGVPLLIGITAVLAALGMVALPSEFLPVDANLPAVILLIGLAVGVDYSLFYLRREREERAAGAASAPRSETAAATSGRAVLISGVTVIVAMAGMFISGDKSFISFAEGAIVVVAIAVFASLTVLPAMLSWLGDRVEKGRIPVLGRRRRPAGQSRFWAALTGRVMRRPGLSILLAGGLLVALAIPALQMKIVTSGVEQLPQDIPDHRDLRQGQGRVPDRGRHGDRGRRGRRRALGRRRRRHQRPAHRGQGLPGVPAREPRSSTARTARSRRSTSRPPAAATTPRRRTPSTCCATDHPGDGRAGPRARRVNVSGEAASSEDFASQLKSRLPLIFAFVFGLAFLLMLVTFRSIVIPIKAIILNLLSVGAAYGVLVLVFQNGHGESLLGFTSIGGVTNWLPLFLFVVLFGLSMDYHVFILSRVRELYDRGMSTDEAVKQGISTTAGTVTSAAAVMVGVFAVFITLSFLDFKELGLRARRGRPDRRDHHPRRPAARVDEAARRLELVPAPLAGMAPARRRGTRRRPTCRTQGPGSPGRAGTRCIHHPAVQYEVAMGVRATYDTAPTRARGALPPLACPGQSSPGQGAAPARVLRRDRGSMASRLRPAGSASGGGAPRLRRARSLPRRSRRRSRCRPSPNRSSRRMRLRPGRAVGWAAGSAGHTRWPSPNRWRLAANRPRRDRQARPPQGRRLPSRAATQARRLNSTGLTAATTKSRPRTSLGGPAEP